MKLNRYFFQWPILLAMMALMFMLGACGGSSSGGGSSAPAATKVAVPTMPVANFAQPTTMIDVKASAGVTQTAPTGTPDATPTQAELDLGARLYQEKGCGDCHGAQAEGVSSKGSALAGTKLSASQFDDVMRTGDKGKLGVDHIYGPNAISPEGMRAIHAWLVSLSAGK